MWIKIINLLNISKESSGLIYAIFAAIIWGFLALKLKLALKFLDPLSVVWIRFSVAFALLSFWQLKIKKEKLSFDIKPLYQVVICSIGLGLNYWGYLKGVEYNGPVTTQVVIQFGPLLLILFGVLIFNERVKIKHTRTFVIDTRIYFILSV